MNNIASVLARQFEKHRVVFWYDSKRELRAEFESLMLPGVETIELVNNEFAVKHRILREQPDTKFLLYHEGPQPEDLENWLLDLQLASGLFLADQASLWLSDLGLPARFLDLAQLHGEFFNAESRRRALKALLPQPLEETETSLRLKMLAVCAGAEPRLAEIVESLLSELAQGETAAQSLIRRSGLEPFLWEGLKRTFGYQSTSPSIQDFAIELFKSCYSLALQQSARLNNDALIFLRRWKDSLSHRQAFEALSERFAELLNIENDLQARDAFALVELDFFRLIDQKILSDLVLRITQRTISSGECAALVRQRKRTHWFSEFQHYYAVLEYAAQFLYALDTVNFQVRTLAEGIQRYAQTWHHIDHLYRKIIFHFRKSGHASLLGGIIQVIENHYNTSYLLNLHNEWQPVIDTCTQWEASSVPVQRDFFEHYVSPFLKNKKKIYVIISDALRYEIADELLSLVRREDRYDAEIEPMLGMVPSYTQLGMAALLPNREITFVENGAGTVLVDGMATQGAPNRDKILKNTVPQSCAIRAEDLLGMGKDKCRALVRDHNVVYVYHNRIDSIGDKRESEERVFEAAEDALGDLLNIIKKLTAANATNLIVTADHGFIYQNRAIEDSDFSSAALDPNDARIQHFDRRFVLGHRLDDQPGLKKFHANQVGLAGDMEILLPKSIQRLRQKGSGSRYVHGGGALPELVVPVLHVNKKRESDTSRVEVDIMRGAGTLITSGQLSVVFYQVQPVSEKVWSRKLRAGIYSLSGVLVSDQHELDFDLAEENARERETPVRFMLTREADQFNNQEVVLRLDEQIDDTSHYREYKSLRYTLRRSFTSDFEF